MKISTAKILYLALCALFVLCLPLICSQPATDADTDSWCIMELCLLGAFALCGWLLGKRIPDAGEKEDEHESL